MAEIIWAPRAIKDINKIAEFIAKDSIHYAEEQVRLFSKLHLHLNCTLTGEGLSLNWAWPPFAKSYADISGSFMKLFRANR